jgi:hypothetical protein
MVLSDFILPKTLAKKRKVIIGKGQTWETYNPEPKDLAKIMADAVPHKANVWDFI